MRLYKEIRFCRNCNAKFFADPKTYRNYYCEACNLKHKSKEVKTEA